MRNPYVFNRTWWESHAGELGRGYEPIIVPTVAKGYRMIFLPSYYNYRNFTRLADIAVESGYKVEPGKRGWKKNLADPYTICNGRPEWQLHHSENGWSTWCDLRAASLSESEYQLFQKHIDCQFNLFLDELTRGSSVFAACQVADTNIITLSPNQGLTLELEENPWKNPNTIHRCRPSVKSASIAVAEALMKSTFAR